MWLGILFHEEGDDRPGGPDEDLQALLIYQSDRILVAGGPLTGAANAVMTLRSAATRAGPGCTGLPRCGRCGADLGMPDLDAEEARCASS